MKKVFLTIFILITLISCKKNEYKDISSIGIDYPTCPYQPVTQPKIFLDHEYAIDIVDDSVYLYTEDNKLIGIVKLEGQLDSLITLDNQ